MNGSVVGTVLRSLLEDPGRGSPAPERVAELVRGVDPLLTAPEVDRAVGLVRADMDGLGPIVDLLADPEVTDVMINGPGRVWVDRGRGVEATDLSLTAAEVDRLVERIVAPLGRRVDPVSPVADARLVDGSRVHIVVPPLAIDGTCVTIRRFSARSIGVEEVAAPEVAELIRNAVRSRANIVISGGTGSGKTTLLNALARHMASDERVVTIEDAAELRLPFDHVVRLETRPPSPEGVPEMTARELLRNALRMRPDRIILGEVRGPEALDLIAAMNTGHDGSLSTVHANGCEDALRRLETLILLAGIGLPLGAVRDHMAAAIDLIVHIERDATGGRRIVEVGEPAEPPVGDAAPMRMLVERDGRVAPPTRRRLDAGARR